MSQSRTMAWGFAAAVMMVACAMIPRADGASSRPPTVGELAARVGAAEYYMLPDRGVELVDGVLVGMDDLEGEFFTPNRRLSRGVYHNFTSEVIRLTLGDAVYDVAPGGVVGVGRYDASLESRGKTRGVSDPDQPPNVQPGPPGSVICRDGYYACCVYGKDGKKGTAKCVKNSVTAECDAGGPGAVACTTVVD